MYDKYVFYLFFNMLKLYVKNLPFIYYLYLYKTGTLYTFKMSFTYYKTIQIILNVIIDYIYTVPVECDSCEFEMTINW